MVTATPTAMVKMDEDSYRAKDGSFSLKREHGFTPIGNPLNGQWVLRGANGEFLDFNQYRNDLAERHSLNLP
jgi:hypothetical protein